MTPATQREPVADASALLVVVFREPGRMDAVAKLEGAFISTVNLSEALQKAVQKGGTADEVSTLVEFLGISAIDFSFAQAKATAELWPVTASKGLSLGDRACIALAIELGRPILTADRAWADLALPVPLELIQR